MMMDRENAMRWCSSNLSAGIRYGSAWAYFFTSLKNHLEDVYTATLAIDDNGSFDEKLSRVGCEKYSEAHIKEICKAYNVGVVFGKAPYCYKRFAPPEGWVLEAALA
jgi:hypothetical protein